MDTYTAYDPTLLPPSPVELVQRAAWRLETAVGELHRDPSDTSQGTIGLRVVLHRTGTDSPPPLVVVRVPVGPPLAPTSTGLSRGTFEVMAEVSAGPDPDPYLQLAYINAWVYRRLVGWLPSDADTNLTLGEMRYANPVTPVELYREPTAPGYDADDDRYYTMTQYTCVLARVTNPIAP